MATSSPGVSPLGLKTKIVTPRYGETIAFYERIIGLRHVEEWDEPGDKGCILAISGAGGEAFLEIYSGQAETDWASLSLQFRVEQVDAVVAALPRDVRYSGPTDRPWGSRYLYLADPNGIQVILFSGGL